LVGGIFSTPLISYSATSPTLSDKTQNPFFFRTVPSDAAQGEALALLVQSLNQTKCIVVNSEDVYGFGIAAVFQAVALNISLDVRLLARSRVVMYDDVCAGCVGGYITQCGHVGRR
jgi:hypothetical protein